MLSEHGSIDLSFTLNSIIGTPVVELRTNILAISQSQVDFAVKYHVDVYFTIEEISGLQYIIFGTNINNRNVDEQDHLLGYFTNSSLNIHIVIYDQYVSGYCNEMCVYTYALRAVEYPETLELFMATDMNNTDITNIVLREIPDAREAVWIDYEANTESAIQSVIQQRPIEINAEVDREINFTYDATKDNVAAHHIKAYEDTIQDNLLLSSDGIVYYEDVGIAISEDTAEQVGFITRMYRLSELSTGAVEAAKKRQRSALQKRHAVSLLLTRLDPRIEPRDVIDINIIVTGTRRNIIDSIIVEDSYISVQDGDYSTRITGRKNA